RAPELRDRRGAVVARPARRSVAVRPGPRATGARRGLAHGAGRNRRDSARDMSRLRAVLLTTDYPPRSGGIARLLDELVRGTDDTVDWRVLDVRAESPRRVAASGRRATRVLLALPAGGVLRGRGHPS